MCMGSSMEVWLALALTELLTLLFCLPSYALPVLCALHYCAYHIVRAILLCVLCCRRWWMRAQCPT